MNSLFYLAFVVLLTVISLVYFKLARVYKIVDIPNHRTMHEGATIRGGGAVVWFGMIVFTLLFFNPGYYFLAGLTIIGLTGFLDDLIDLSSKIRFPLQAISIVLILFQLNLFDTPILWLLVILIVSTGILNAFNFMDGINGMTAGYSLVFISTLIYLHYYVQPIIEVEFLYGYFLALLVFSFFNFRKKAVCFAGDVGSLSIAFINVFLLLKLMNETGNFIFVFLFALYGIDTIFTIIQRLYRKENIFEAHKLHLFQLVVDHYRISHLKMTGIYMLIQILMNIVIISTMSYGSVLKWSIVFIGLTLLSIWYIWIKSKILTKSS